MIDFDFNDPLDIRKATADDIKEIESVYRDRVNFNDKHDIHQWNLEEVTWEALSKLYSLDNCYVGVFQRNIIAIMMIVDEDALYWPQSKKGEALYLHKLVVHPACQHVDFSFYMIRYFKEKGQREGYPCVRLDVREHKTKLINIYEKSGFVLDHIVQVHPEYRNLLYTFSTSAT